MGVGLCLSTLKGLVDVSTELISLPKLQGFPALYAWLVVETLFLIVLRILAPIYLLVVFAGRKHEFPNHYIICLWANVVFVFANAFVVELLLTGIVHKSVWPEALSQATGMFLVAVIWSLYMRKSQRVKATFVER